VGVATSTNYSMAGHHSPFLWTPVATVFHILIVFFYNLFIMTLHSFCVLLFVVHLLCNFFNIRLSVGLLCLLSVLSMTILVRVC